MIANEAIAWSGILLSVSLAGLILYWGFSSRARQARSLLIAAIAGILLLALLASPFLRASAVFIQLTDRGVVISALDQGVRPEPLQPGLNFVVPFLEYVIEYSITRQTYTMSAQIVGDDSVEARTSDGQVVRVDASVIFSIDPRRVVETHILWQGQYVDNLIRPLARGIIRDAVSQFGVQEVRSTGRSAMAQLVTSDLKDALEEGGLILHEFVLINIISAEDQPDLPESSGVAEPEIPALSGPSQSSALEKIRSTLEGLGCIVLPILMIAAVIARRRRPIPGSQSTPQYDIPADAHLGEQALGRGERPTSAAWEEYEQGMAYLEQELFEEAKDAFMRAFRNADNPDLRQKALTQLEALGEVTKF
jgi:hypothetical protein